MARNGAPASKKIAQVIVRSQHARKGRSGWYGPARYVTLVVMPEGSPPVGSTPLDERITRKRGWELYHCGSGYSRSGGPGSQLGAALLLARRAAHVRQLALIDETGAITPPAPLTVEDFLTERGWLQQQLWQTLGGPALEQIAATAQAALFDFDSPEPRRPWPPVSQEKAPRGRQVSRHMIPVDYQEERHA